MVQQKLKKKTVYFASHLCNKEEKLCVCLYAFICIFLLFHAATTKPIWLKFENEIKTL